MRKTIKKCFQRIEVVALPVPNYDASERGLTPGDEFISKIYAKKLGILKRLLGNVALS